MASPYEGLPEDLWQERTRALVDAHPLTLDVIHDAALVSWSRLWNTIVGDAETGFPLADLDPPATVVGYFFEKIFSKELAQRLPGQWRGGTTGTEKDLHCLTDDTMSVEMKSSGQLGTKVFGNRSYGQKNENAELVKKDKSGYYITINFYKQCLTLLRFGWIDADDWQAQKAATGQMAGLPESVYRSKLVVIRGAYMLAAPVQLLPGIGSNALAELNQHGIHTVGDLVARQPHDVPAKHLKRWQAARAGFADLL
jgi:ScaI restriction endonuclease